MATGASATSTAAAALGATGGGGGTTATGGSTTAGGLLGPPPPLPLFTPIVFCLPNEGASLSLAPLASRAAAAAAIASVAHSVTGTGASAGEAAAETGGGEGNSDAATKALPAALLPIANRPLIAFALQQLVSAGIRHAVVCAPAAQHTLFAQTLRQLALTPPLSASTSTAPNVQVLIDPLPGTSRRATPSANTYVLRIDLIPLGPLDRADRTRIPASGPTTAAPPAQQIEAVKSNRKVRQLGSAELLLWLASEGWLEADPLVVPYDLLTPSLPLAALIRAHQIASALLPSTTFAPGCAPANSLPAQSLMLGATTLLIEKRTPANTRSKAAQGDAASKERLKAERKTFADNDAQDDRLVVFSKQHFGALHGFSSSTLAAPHTGGFISSAPAAATATSLIAEAPHSAHALLFSAPLNKTKSKSSSASFVLPPAVGNRTLGGTGSGVTGATSHAQRSLSASAHISTNLQDSGVYILPRAVVLPLLERFSSPQNLKIRTVPHLVSLLARASSDTAYARKLGIDTLVRRLARSYAQTHAERAGLGPLPAVSARSGTLDDAASLRASGALGGAGAGLGAAGLADSLMLGSAAGTGNATPGLLSSPPIAGGGARSGGGAFAPSAGEGAARAAASAGGVSANASSDSADPLLLGLGESMSRLSVSIAAAHSSASRSSVTGERSSTAVRHFTSASGSEAAPAEIRVQAVVARLQTDAEAFVLGSAEEASTAGPAQQAGGKGKGGSNAPAAKVHETERFLGRVDTPARYLEANKFLIRALAAPSPSPLFPIPSISEAGTLGAAPPVDSSANTGGGAAPQPQITPDALIASSSSVTLGDRCVIRRSVVGKGCSIARGAKVLGCVLMPGVSVGENAKLESVILAPHTVVGARSNLVDVDAGPEGVRIPESTDAKVTTFGPASSSSGAGGVGGGAAGGRKGGKAQALGFDEAALAAGLLQGGDDDDESSDEEEEEEEEEETDEEDEDD
ncbi:Translation initiation factor eIF-2B subunit gamma [Tilletia horrida]|nr:Translation initiation factor eIF-2B subunit gamma [Tilletia horrida]